MFACNALMGTTLTEEREELLSAVYDKVIVLLDNEKRKDLENSYQITRKLNNSIEAVDATKFLSLGKDPGIMTVGDFIKILKMIGPIKSRDKKEKFIGKYRI